MKRITNVFGLFVALALMGGGCFRVAPRVVRAPAPEAPVQDEVTAESLQEIGPIAVLKVNGGRASLTRDGESRDAKDGVEVLPGDTIQATSGTVALVYPEAGASLLEAGSSVTVLPDGEGVGSVFAQLELTVGSIWTRFERLLGADERFSVSGNGVVATVRGTAFGFSIVDGEADVQVAESEVDVGLIEARKDAKLLAKAVRLAKGEGLRIHAATLKGLEPTEARKRIRTLAETERARAIFRRVEKPLLRELLRRPATRIRLERLPAIPRDFEDRVDPRVLERIRLLRALQTSGFTAPTRPAGTQEVAPTALPTLRLAPTSTSPTP
ncbi:hypothetical protein HY479_00195 [Candidatus Uhrbacteria bacterium]|nr:hypothetical protein [Candidatus Uhrbacteria bacterium]